MEKNKAQEKVRAFVIIPLTKGMFTIIDKEDEKRVKKAGFWSAKFCGQKYYATRNSTKALKETRLARFLLNAPKGMVVDHINGITLDNRKSNLRVCTQAENMRNHKLYRTNKSGFSGVFFANRDKKWRAVIKVEKKAHYLGSFETKEAAVAVRQKAEKLRSKPTAKNAAITDLIELVKKGV